MLFNLKKKKEKSMTNKICNFKNEFHMQQSNNLKYIVKMERTHEDIFKAV